MPPKKKRSETLFDFTAIGEEVDVPLEEEALIFAFNDDEMGQMFRALNKCDWKDMKCAYCSLSFDSNRDYLIKHMETCRINYYKHFGWCLLFLFTKTLIITIIGQKATPEPPSKRQKLEEPCVLEQPSLEILTQTPLQKIIAEVGQPTESVGVYYLKTQEESQSYI